MAGSVSIRKALQLPFGSKRRENQLAPADQDLHDMHETSHSEADAEFPGVSPHIDPTEWFPHYRNCVSHFVNVAQHTAFAQALAAFLNIHLPYQKTSDRDTRLPDRSARQPETFSRSMSSVRLSPVSLVPYIRRLVVTATDTPSILHRLFGEEWNAGIGHIQTQERINYLFAAKSSGWATTKSQYDILPEETVPFLKPLREPSEEEIRTAEARWSDWLAMEDWMVGPRSFWEG